MGTNYDVRVKYQIDSSGAKNQVTALSSAFDSLGGFASSAGSAMDSMAGKLLTVGTAIAGVAAAGAIGAIKVGLVDVNAKLESASIGFATIFNMLGSATNFDQGLGMGKELIADIRADAAALPGEFQDFVGIAQTLAAPLTNAGKGIKEIRALTSDTAVAAAAMGVAFDTAGREMAMLLEGRAGAHNTLGMRMGITKDTMVNGKSFNKASESERFDFITKKLEKAKDSLPAFQKSWSGLTSTMVDGVKAFLGRTTLPLFERMKTTMAGVIDVLSSPRVGKIADMIGKDLVIAYDAILGKVEWIAGHWKQIHDSGVRFAEEIRGAFEAAWPYVEKIGNFLGEKLKDPGAFIKELVGLRVGLAAASAAPGAASGIGSMMGGGGGAEGAAMAAAGVGAAAALALLAVAAAGAADLLLVDQKKNGKAFEAMSDVAKGTFDHVKEMWGGLMDDLKSIWEGLKPIIDILGIAFIGALDALIIYVRAVIFPFKVLADGLWKLIHLIPGMENSASGGGPAAGAAARIAGAGAYKGPTELKAVDTSKSDAEIELMMAQVGKVSTKLAGKGGQNVTVNNQFTILDQSDPERLAVSISHKVSEMVRNPTKPLGLSTFRHG